MIAVATRGRALLPLGLVPLLAIAVGLMVAGHWLAVVINSESLDWKIGLYKYSLFLISYQDLGFVKRGLVGSLMNLDNDVESWQLITFFSFAVAMTLAIILCWLIKRQESLVIQLLFLLSPGMFLQIGFDLGRMDQINYLLLIVTALTVPRYFIYLAPMMLLIHEGALFITAPLMFALYVHRFGRDRRLAGACVLTFLALAAILIWGDYDGAAPLATIYPVESGAAGLLKEGIIAVMHKSAAQFWTRPWLKSLFLLEAVLLLGLVIWLLHLRAPIDRGRAAVWLCCCAPLALHAVGIDWARWCALAAFNLLLAELVIDRWGSARPGTAPRSLGPTGNAVAVAQVLLGPVGIVSMFPFLLVVRRLIIGP